FNAMASSLSRTLHRLARAEALAAAGEFAARLAHEVRNPLTSIRIDVQRLQMRPGVDTDGTATRVLGQLDRLGSFVGNTLASVRRERDGQRVTDVTTPLINATHAAAPHFARRKATLAVELESRALLAKVDAAAIEQAILNLLVNAAQAVPTGGQA